MKLLNLKIISPAVVMDLKARFISLHDKIGSFGVYPGHRPFITFLDRSVGYYIDQEGNKVNIAYDYGLFRVERNNQLFFISRIILTGKSLESLEEQLSERIKKEVIYSVGMRENIENLQRALMKVFIDSGNLNNLKK